MVTSMRLHPDAGIFEIRLEGEISYAMRLSLLSEIEQKLRGSMVRKLLVDYSHAWPNDETPADIAPFLRRVLDATFTRGTTIAFVNGPAEHCAAVEGISDKGGFHSGRFYDR